MVETECATAELETAASQLHSLAKQSTQALETTEGAAAYQWQNRRVQDICEGLNVDFLLSVHLSKGIFDWKQNIKD